MDVRLLHATGASQYGDHRWSPYMMWQECLNQRQMTIGASIMATEVKTVDINPTPFFIPPRVGGDREFNGHGPRVEVSATLAVRNANELWASVYMHAKETTHD